MSDLVPEAAVRQALEREMRRLPLVFFQEGVPVPARWAERPCAFVLLSEAYRENAADPRGHGWLVAEIPDVQHLEPVTDPMAVTDALLGLEGDLAKRM